MNTSYALGMKYEMFIRNVYDCESGMKNGAHLCFMQNAINMENGETFSKHLGSFDKQFKVVKSYIEKALTKVIKTKKYTKSIDVFNGLLLELEGASSTSTLLNIVDIGLNEILKYRKDN